MGALKSVFCGSRIGLGSRLGADFFAGEATSPCSLDSEETLGEHEGSENGLTHPNIGDAAFSAPSALVSSMGPRGASVWVSWVTVTALSLLFSSSFSVSTFGAMILSSRRLLISDSLAF